MPFEIVRNDITNMCVDAIVNTANPYPVVGSGVDSSIHKKAGAELLMARQEIGEIAYGDVAITSAFGLEAKYVMHAVSPVWYGGKENEQTLLTQCYEKSLTLAVSHGCESIAFPLLSAGNQGFPPDVAMQTAIGVCSKFLMRYDMQIYLVVFDHNAVVLSEKLFHSVKHYIDEHYVQEKELEEYVLYNAATTNRIRPQSPMPMMAMCEAPRSLEDLVNELDDTFSESLIRHIDRKGLKDADVYKKANIDRKLFHKIKNNKDHKPTKATALAFAIALELSLDETLDLIGRAGFTLTHSSKFDIIIEYFLLEENYDIFEINETLFHFGQPTLVG